MKKFGSFIKEKEVTIDDVIAMNEAKFSNANLGKVSELLARIASKKLKATFKFAWKDTYKKATGQKGHGYRYVSSEGLQIRFNHVSSKNSYAVNSVDYWKKGDAMTEPSLTISFGEDVNIVKLKEQLFDTIKSGSLVKVTAREVMQEAIKATKAQRQEFAKNNGIGISYTFGNKVMAAKVAQAGLDTEYENWMNIQNNVSEKTEFDTKIRVDEEKIHKNTFWADPKYVFDDMVKATEVIAKGQWKSLIILGAPGLGKTYGTKEVLTKTFGPPVDGPSGQWVIKTGEATSMAGIYKTFLANKHKVIVYDDSDDIWGDGSIVNFLKAATADGEGDRVLSYGKASAANVDMMSAEAAAEYEIDYIDSLSEDPNSKMKPPSRFVFTGAFINISNFPASFFSKGGPAAVASRSIMIDLHLAERDVLRRIATLLSFQGDSEQEIAEILDAITTDGSDAVTGTGLYDPKKIGKIVYMTPEEARKNKGISMRSANIAKAFRDAGIADWARMTGLYA